MKRIIRSMLNVIPETEIVVVTVSRENLNAFCSTIGEGTHGSRIELHVVLMPDIAQGRVIDIPKLGKSERRELLTREATRYFPVVDIPHVCDGIVVSAGSPAGHQRVFAVAAPLHVVETIHDAAALHHLKLASVTTAYSAWAAGSQKLHPQIRKESGWVSIPYENEVLLMRIERGQITDMRRTQRDRDPSSIAEDFYSPDMAAEQLAVLGATSCSGPELRTSKAYLERTRQARTTRRTAVASFVLLLSAVAGLMLFNRYRELRTIAVERERLKPITRTALASQSWLDTQALVASELRKIAETSPRWSRILSGVVDQIPEGARLESLESSGDTIIATGVSNGPVRSRFKLRFGGNGVEASSQVPQ